MSYDTWKTTDPDDEFNGISPVDWCPEHGPFEMYLKDGIARCAACDKEIEQEEAREDKDDGREI